MKFLKLVLCMAVSTALAGQVRPVNLEEMTARAARIFSGHCVETTTTRDPVSGRAATLATFEVERAIKGDLGKTVTVEFLGGSGVAGLPSFRSGEEVVLFLYGVSSAGLSSPVGWLQGKFTIIEDKHGDRIAVNGLGNAALFRGLSDQAVTRLGSSTVHQWEGRKGVEARALLDMVDALLH